MREEEQKEKREKKMASSSRDTQDQLTGSISRSSKNTNSSNKAMAIARYIADAQLLHAFEQSAESSKPFDYTTSMKSAKESVSDQQITAYLSRLQRGGRIQPHGCVLAVEESTFRIIAYSENAVEMLDIAPQAVPCTEEPQSQSQILTIGTDVRTLFTLASAHSLEKAAAAQKLSLMNPICVHCKNSGKPFYASVHRIDVGMVIDFEPLRTGDAFISAGGAVHSEKLAMRVISCLQSLPRGDIALLCDTVVQNVRELTGYDRAMVYKFHEDEHGEIVAEIKPPDLESYLGLHYPATDIPQAARFLFMQNKVRMICDCKAVPVKLIQSQELTQPLCLVGSTLRASHECHLQFMTNMGSIASLVMAVIINGNDSAGGGNGRNSMKLWGLVVCHHTSPRAVPFHHRYACEYLMQAFGLQLSMELQVAAQLKEKRIFRIQTLLCDMLLRDGPIGIVTRSPSIVDLVKCDGAALYYRGMCWMLGMTPTEAQIVDIADWLLEYHGDSTGINTDSLTDAGYPGATYLGDAVCGMAAARINSKDFVFWFRSQTAKELKWGGTENHSSDKDYGRMHPTSSFKAFLEVVQRRSLPWEDVEIDAIHSLQLILRGSFQDIDESGTKAMVHSELEDSRLQGLDKLRSVATEMVRVIETATAPIFAVDSNGLVTGWNAKVAELTGLPVGEAMGKSLVQDLVFEESVETVKKMLYRALRGEEEKNVEMMLRTFGPQKQKKAVILVANACSSRDYTENIVGVCFVGQDVTSQKVAMDKFAQIQGDYKSIVQNPNPLIPPIFASDKSVCCSEWNAAMEKVTGWTRDEVVGKMLVGEIFGGCCPLKDQGAVTEFTVLLHSAINGHEIEKFPFAFFDRNGNYVEALLTANKRTDADGQIIGSFCFLQMSASNYRRD